MIGEGGDNGPTELENFMLPENVRTTARNIAVMADTTNK